jgi:hypothetical protein
MFRSLNDLIGYSVRTENGDAGKVNNFYFDDLNWFVRYMIIDTGGLFDANRLFISPVVIEHIDRENQTILLKLTTERIAASPNMSDRQGLTRGDEVAIHEFFNWPAYWEEAGVPAVEAGLSGWSVTEMMTDVEGKHREATGGQERTLRNFTEMAGYRIISRDEGEVARLDDILVNDEDWRIMYMIGKVSGLLPGKNVLLSPAWISQTRYEQEEIAMDLTAETLRNSPEYNSDMPLDKDYEERLYQHYQRKL